MGYFGLKLQEDKSRLIKFGWFAQQDTREKDEKAATFDFLGFTHYCSRNKSCKFKVKRRIGRKKCREMWEYIRSNRYKLIDMLTRKLNEILAKYDHYYMMADNHISPQKFRYNIRKFLYYRLN